MERYLSIAKVNLKFNLLPNLAVSILLLLITPAFMGIKNLNPGQTAQVLEFYVALLGIILLVPVFLPDQNRDIRDLTVSKKTAISQIHLLRLIEATIFLILLVGAFLIVLVKGGCDFPEWNYFFGTLAQAIFLGGIGILAYGISDLLPVAYMVPILYYMVNFGGSKFPGKFYLFSMIQGSFIEKWYLFFGGIFCIILAIWYRSRQK